MNMKHTGGPWVALERYTNRQAISIGRKIGSMSHEIFAEAHGHNCEANARLIASAPELLEALELLVKEVECYCADNVAAKGLCGICSAKAALAKAKGEA